MGAVWELGNTVQCSYTMCKADGSSVDIKTVSSKEPSKPANGDYWIDTSQKKHSLKVWSDTSAMWISVATTYIKISAPNIGKVFSEGDGVTISGCTKCADLNTTLVIQSKSDDSIIVIGLIDTIGNQTGGLKVSRSIPDMDYITESNNRLWGCYYGIKDGKWLMRYTRPSLAISRILTALPEHPRTVTRRHLVPTEYLPEQHHIRDILLFQRKLYA